MNDTTRQHPKHRVLAEVQGCSKCMERFWTAIEKLKRLDAKDKQC